MIRPEAVYSGRIETIDGRLVLLKRIELALSLLKLIFVSVGIYFLLRIAQNSTRFSIAAFFFCFASFVCSALVHEHFIRQRNDQRTLREINADEIQACQGIFLDYPDGGQFDDADHPYVSDLDIFGKRGLFHFINRTATSLGEKVLSDWLKEFPGPNGTGVLTDKQKAVEELSEKIDFRQNLQANGRRIEDSLARLKSVKDFFEEPDAVLGRRFLVGLIHFLPLLTGAFIVLIFFGWSWLFALVAVLLQGAVNRILKEKIMRVYVLTAKNYKNLSVYSRIITEIEKENFASPQLDKMRRCFFIKRKPASFYIKKLSTRFQYFEARSNAMIHFFMNNIFFWDLHCIFRIEKWKKKLREVIGTWFDSIGRFDALSSLANIRFNHPGWCFPEVRDGGFRWLASSIGHPLIPEEERIVNSIEMKGETNITFITGPNMAGKTTFLKTIGVNTVLALAGAPVCAGRFVISPVRLYTSMKVSDSLDKGLSLFYAELQRLKMVLDAILDREPSFFLIDEMLKGTNELDRHKGAVSLVRQLAEQKAHGILATHDMQLTGLEKEYPERIRNYHFDGYIEEDRLLFDYKLKEGACTSSNALELMKKIGIRVL